MKRKSIWPLVVFCCVCLSCRHHDDIDIQYRESTHSYSMDAWFHENRTRAVEEYMDDKIGRQSNVSFVNTRIDGRIGLDDHTSFLLKKSPGHVRIELDKRKNSYEGYREIKALCEGIKEVVK